MDWKAAGLAFWYLFISIAGLGLILAIPIGLFYLLTKIGDWAVAVGFIMLLITPIYMLFYSYFKQNNCN